MSFYCAEKGKGRDCCLAVTLGLNQCHYCYEYQRGYVEPTSPLPVISDEDATMRAIKDLSQWYTNGDDFWRWL